MNGWLSFAPCSCSKPRASCGARTTQPGEFGLIPGTEPLDLKPRLICLAHASKLIPLTGRNKDLNLRYGVRTSMLSYFRLNIFK